MDRLQICTAADVNYKMQLSVILKSLVLSQKSIFDFYVMGNGWTEKDKKDIQNFSRNSVNIVFYDVDIQNFKSVKLSGKFPLATIYNLLAPLEFFSKKQKILYLDCDMIVQEDLNSIWNLEFSESVAAVVDSHVGVNGNPSMWRPWRKLDVNPLSKYLNTGLLLINVKKWNEARITDKCVNLLTTFSLPCLDQDALNLVLNGNFYSLPPRFNSMPMHFMPKLRYSDLIENDIEILEAMNNPAIIHFHRSFFGKPWNLGSTHPYTKNWRVLAREVKPNWLPKIDLKEIARITVARVLGLSSMDPRFKNSKLSY